MGNAGAIFISTLSNTDNKMAAPKIFSRVAVFQAPSVGARNLATLKDIRLRLRSVMNIQKITKSMKMVSAAKYARAERELQPARVYGAGANSLLENLQSLIIWYCASRRIVGCVAVSILVLPRLLKPICWRNQLERILSWYCVVIN